MTNLTSFGLILADLVSRHNEENNKVKDNKVGISLGTRTIKARLFLLIDKCLIVKFWGSKDHGPDH